MFLDTLAAAWLAWRTEQNIKRHAPELAEFGLRKIGATPGGWEATYITPAAAIIAEEMAAMLNKAQAKNYVQFDFMPRLDRGLRPVRVTVEWAHGEPPAAKAARLEKKLADLMLDKREPEGSEK